MACSSSTSSADCAAGGEDGARKVTGLPFPPTPRSCSKAMCPGPHAGGRPVREWTGHYAGGVRQIPVLDIKAIYYRNDPIVWAYRRWAAAGRDGALPRRDALGHHQAERHQCRRAGRAAGLVP